MSLYYAIILLTTATMSGLTVIKSVPCDLTVKEQSTLSCCESLFAF